MEAFNIDKTAYLADKTDSNYSNEVSEKRSALDVKNFRVVLSPDTWDQMKPSKEINMSSKLLSRSKRLI